MQVKPRFSLAARMALLLALHSPAQPAFADHIETGALAQDFTGTLQITQGDNFTNGTFVRHYHLESNANKRALHFHDSKAKEVLDKLSSGAQIRIRGYAHHGHGGQEEIVVGAGDSTSVQVLSSGTVAAVSGVQSTIAILVNFSDSSVGGFTAGQANDILFAAANSVNKFYQESSYGNISVAGEAHGPVTINLSGNGCDTSQIYNWASAADSAAQAAGISLSGFTHRVYYMKPTNCGYGGYGTIGGNPSRAWIFYANNNIWAHELGHNLGMHHASTPGSEYGDGSDVMGNSYNGLNAAHRLQMGWIPAANVIDVRQSGTFTLASVETAPATTSNPLVLRIPKADTSENYYLSMRQAVGFDSGMSSGYLNGTNLHTHNGSSQTFFQRNITSSFTDTANGIAVTHLSNSQSAASVRVDLVCIANRAVASLSPAAGYSTSAGSAAYTLSVVNKDSMFCGATTFSLSCSSSLGVSAAVASLSLNPGASGSTTVTVSGSGAADASYPVSCQVSGQSAAQDASASTSHIVDSVAPTAPGQPYLQAMNRKSATLKWTASVDNYGVLKYRVFKNGAVLGETSSAQITDPNVNTKIDNTYTAISLDYAGNQSPASAPFVLKAAGGNGGGGKGKP